MSTIKSSDEHLTLNADGSSKDIKFQANGVEKASISSSGAFTSTTIDATKLTGALPAISGAALTGVGVSGISSSADATAMTITSDENIGIGTTTPPERLSIHEPSTGTGTYLPVAITGANYATGYGVGISFKTENTSPTQKAKAAIIGEGTGEGYNKTSLHIAMSNTGDTTTEVSLADSVLEFTMDGRGLSQFTAKAWVNLNGEGTIAFRDSHNCSSLTDNGTGDYTVTYSNSMANSNYASVGMAGKSATSQQVVSSNHSPNTAYTRFQTTYNNGNLEDTTRVMVVIFGD
jgi:hypothetical protein